MSEPLVVNQRRIVKTWRIVIHAARSTALTPCFSDAGVPVRCDSP
jgi:hypothetical protein